MRHLLPRRDLSILAHWQQQQLCLLLPEEEEEEEVGEALGTTWPLQRASSVQLFPLVSLKGLLGPTLQPSLLQGLFPFVALKHHVHAGWWLEMSVAVTALVIANHKWHMNLQMLDPGRFWPHSKKPEHSCLSFSQQAGKQNAHKPQAVPPREVLQNPGPARELVVFVFHLLDVSAWRERQRDQV